eukprot:jgi/Psemu1/25075/gm1.25075_g
MKTFKSHFGLTQEKNKKPKFKSQSKVATQVTPKDKGEPVPPAAGTNVHDGFDGTNVQDRSAQGKGCTTSFSQDILLLALPIVKRNPGNEVVDYQDYLNSVQNNLQLALHDQLYTSREFVKALSADATTLLSQLITKIYIISLMKSDSKKKKKKNKKAKEKLLSNFGPIPQQIMVKVNLFLFETAPPNKSQGLWFYSKFEDGSLDQSQEYLLTAKCQCLDDLIAKDIEPFENACEEYISNIVCNSMWAEENKADDFFKNRCKEVVEKVFEALAPIEDAVHRNAPGGFCFKEVMTGVMDELVVKEQSYLAEAKFAEDIEQNKGFQFIVETVTSEDEQANNTSPSDNEDDNHKNGNGKLKPPPANQTQLRDTIAKNKKSKINFDVKPPGKRKTLRTTGNNDKTGNGQPRNQDVSDLFGALKYDYYGSTWVYCKHCYLDSPLITTGYGKKKVTKKKKPPLFTARQRKNMGVVVSPSLLDHISHNGSCYSYYYQSLWVDDFSFSLFIQKSQKPQDASDKIGLTNTCNNPLSSGLVPEVLGNQVMYDPSVESMERALIGQELANIEDDKTLFDDYDEEEGIDSKLPPSLSVNREGNNISADDSSSGSNKAIMTPNVGRHASDKLKVKIKLMEIMQNHSIPLVAEKELYKRAIELKNLNLFSLKKGNLIQTRSRVMREIYATVPEIEDDDGFEPHLIDWCYKKLLCADVPGHKQIYIWSFQKVLHSLLKNVMLVKEENLSFPHAEDPTLPVRFPELQSNIDVDKLHHGEWWINTWEKRCTLDSNEILWSNHSYPTEHDTWHIEHLNLELLARCMGNNIYFHPTGSRDKGDKSIDNVNNLHSGLRFALSSLKDASPYFIGDTPQHNQLCGNYQMANTKMICRHCNCPRALGNNSRVNVLKIPFSVKSGNMQVSKHKNGEEYQSIWLWKMSNFTAPTVEKGVNVQQYFKNIPHHHVHNGNAFDDLDFGENPHNIHLASQGERLHMHQLGCAKQAAETFSEEFLGNNTRLLGDMNMIASYYGAAIQRQSNHDFPQTNFSESIHTAKKEENQYIGKLYIQMLTLLSAEVDNQSRKCEEEIDEYTYAIELLLGMEEFLKYAGTFDEVFKEDKKGVLNLDKMVVHFINCINDYLQQSKGEGSNLVKNHMYFHLSQYMRLFGPPTGWDSAASESNHKTQVKAPAERTQQIHTNQTNLQVINGIPYY